MRWMDSAAMTKVGITTNVKKVIDSVLKSAESVTKSTDISDNPPPKKKPRKKLKQTRLSWAKHSGVTEAGTNVCKSCPGCVHSLALPKAAAKKKKR